jgi:ATP/maltotriose-dependent transcriptional regulator MalT
MLFPVKEGDRMLPELTDRENEILKLIADGLTNREISCALTISESTVENHIHHIYGKLGITNRAQAVAHALRVSILWVGNMVGSGK